MGSPEGRPSTSRFEQRQWGSDVVMVPVTHGTKHVEKEQERHYVTQQIYKTGYILMDTQTKTAATRKN